MYIKDSSGKIIIDEHGAKFWINDYLKQNFEDFIIPKVRRKIAYKRTDLFFCIDGPCGCLSGDTILNSQKLSELSLKTVYLKSFDFETNKEIIGKGAVIPSGKKEVFEIETEDGRKIKATAEHVFFVKRDGKIIELKLKDINEGDELVCK